MRDQAANVKRESERGFNQRHLENDAHVTISKARSLSQVAWLVIVPIKPFGAEVVRTFDRRKRAHKLGRRAAYTHEKEFGVRDHVEDSAVDHESVVRKYRSAWPFAPCARLRTVPAGFVVVLYKRSHVVARVKVFA